MSSTDKNPCAQIRNIPDDNPRKSELVYDVLYALKEKIRCLRRDRPDRKAKSTDHLSHHFAEALCHYAVCNPPAAANRTINDQPANTALQVFDLLKGASWASEDFQWLVASDIMVRFRALLSNTNRPEAKEFYSEVANRSVQASISASGERLTQMLELLENCPQSIASQSFGLVELSAQKTVQIYSSLLEAFEGKDAPLLFTPAPLSAIEKYNGALLAELQKGNSLEEAASENPDVSASSALLGAHLLLRAPESYFEKPIPAPKGQPLSEQSFAPLYRQTVCAPLLASLNSTGVSQRVCCWLGGVGSASPGRQNILREIIPSLTDSLIQGTLAESLPAVHPSAS